MFYHSPVGKKMLDEQPAVMREFMTAYQPLMQNQMKEIMESIREQTESYAKRRKAQQQPQ
jgi:hypothetical protein